MRTVSFVTGVCALLVASSGVWQWMARADDAPQSIYEPEIQNQANEILNQSLGSIDKCYNVPHRWFKDDLAARAFDELLKKAAEPNGLCDQYVKHMSEMPFEISVPLLPGVSMNTEKLCKLIQHPRCPE